MANRRYETLILIHPEQGDAGSKELVGRIRQLVEGQGGVIAQVQEWGTRELAYPIERQRRVYHVLFEYHATPEALAEIERNLKLMEAVLRHLSVRRAESAPFAVARPVLASEPVPTRRSSEGDEAGSGDDADASLMSDVEGV
jgi:small subunit ribosomal protein S6